MNDNVDVKRYIYLRIIAKQNIYAQFDLRLCHRRQQQLTRQHSFPLVQPSTAVVRCSLGSYRMGRQGYIRSYSASANQRCIFFKVRQLLKNKYNCRSLILCYITFETTANLFIVFMLTRSKLRTCGNNNSMCTSICSAATSI